MNGMRFLLACLALLPAGALASTNPYLGNSSTRTYYLAELEDCPGKLDMQPGDLWTLTFPDKLADAFVTRNGLVERRLQDNRLIIAVVGPSGSTPALVLTEDGRAPLFSITIQPGPGGRNKSVIVKPGLPPGGSRCGAAGSAAPRTAAVRATTPTRVVRSAPAPSRPTTATVRPPVATPPPAGRAITPSTRPPVREAARVPVTAATSTPARAVSAPAPARTTGRAVTPPTLPAPASPTRASSSPAPAVATTRTVAAPPVSAPTPSTRLTANAVPATPLSRATTTPLASAPARPVRMAPTPVLPPSAKRLPVSVRTQGPGALRVWVVTGQKQRGVLTFTLSNSLDSGVVLRREDLHVAQASGSGSGALVIPAGQTLTFDVALKGPLPPVLGHLTWSGSVVGSREGFEISALLAL